MDKYFMWIHYERLHDHNKAKHNKTVCIFLGIYCSTCIYPGFNVMRRPNASYLVLDNSKNIIETKKDWLNALKEENSKHKTVPLMSKVSLDSLAYTVYSSGTTGKPKGRSLDWFYHRLTKFDCFDKDKIAQTNGRHPDVPGSIFVSLYPLLAEYNSNKGIDM